MTPEQLTFDYHRHIPARALYPRAAHWHEENEEAFALIIAWAFADTEAGMKHLSMQGYIERLRNPRMRPAGIAIAPSDAVYLVNHNLRRELADYIEAIYPELTFAKRRSASDKSAVSVSPERGGVCI